MKNIVIGLSIAVIFGGGTLFGMSVLASNMKEETIKESIPDEYKSSLINKEIEDNEKILVKNSNEQSNENNTGEIHNNEVKTSYNSKNDSSKIVIPSSINISSDNDKYNEEDDDKYEEEDDDKHEEENDKYKYKNDDDDND